MGVGCPAGFPIKDTVLKDVDKVFMDHFVRCAVRVRVLKFGFEDLGISFREFGHAKIALVSVSINILVLSDMALCSIHLIPPIPTPLIGSREKNHPLRERFGLRFLPKILQIASLLRPAHLHFGFLHQLADIHGT